MSNLKRRKNHLHDELKKEFPFVIVVNKKEDESFVKCTICRAEFSIAIGGRSAITKHVNAKKHKQSLDTAASSSKMMSYLKSSHCGPMEKKLAVTEGTFAFHTIIHNHSFRSMDCTNKLMKEFYNPKFACARTKCEAIITSVFKNYCEEVLVKDLEKASFVTILADASNHNETKLYPILVRYFIRDIGVKVRILNLDSIEGETSDILVKRLVTVINEYHLNNKILALSADNTNTNFGGRKRKGSNNIYTKLKAMLNKNIFGIGCNAHILSNAINTAATSMSIDVETIITNVYLFFCRFTVRVTSLKTFCEEASVEYQKLLGFCKVRWLALRPGIERILKLYEPLRSYFLSMERCPKLLENFFNNELGEVILHFVHSQATIFHRAVQQIESDKITATEVIKVLFDMIEQYREKYVKGFVPLIVQSKLLNIERSNPGVSVKFLEEIKTFYKICYEYIEEWTANMSGIDCFKWIALTNQIQWEQVLESIAFLKEHDFSVDDEELFEEIRRLNLYCSSEKMLQWGKEKVELDVKWTEIFKHFEQQRVNTKNLQILVEAAFCLPGTNASVERVFSIGNDFWSDDKSRLAVKTLSAVLKVKFNLKEYNCQDIISLLQENDNLTKNIHSLEKYNF